MSTIWFDFDNSPHVPVLMPIVHELRRRGYKTFFTARDVAQTVGLLENAREQHVVIDSLFPKRQLKKYLHTANRARHLRKIMKFVRPICGVSHCSRSAILGAWLSGIPNLTMYDYEYINNTIQNRFCTRVLIPEAVDTHSAQNASINLKNLTRYPGLKEQLYLGTFLPDENFCEKYSIPNNGKVIVTYRPPAENSHYHNTDVDAITRALFERLRVNKEQIFLIVTPRLESQRREISLFLAENKMDYLIPEHPLPGADLIYHSDLLITGGGTMVREAAVLGVPAYSIFKGQKGAVDRYLEQQQRLAFIDTTDDVARLGLVKRILISDYLTQARHQLHFICDQIEQMIPVTHRKKAHQHVLHASPPKVLFIDAQKTQI